MIRCSVATPSVWSAPLLKAPAGSNGRGLKNSPQLPATALRLSRALFPNGLSSQSGKDTDFNRVNTRFLDTKSGRLYRKSERVHFWSVSRVRELCSELAFHVVMTKPRPYVKTSNAYGAVGHLSATGLPSTHDRTWCQGNVRHCDDALRYEFLTEDDRANGRRLATHWP